MSEDSSVFQPIEDFGNAWSSISGAFGSSGAHAAHRRNKQLQLMAQEFNSAEALKAREFAHDEAKTARQWNARMVRGNRQFQRKLSNTAIERRMRDMRRSGLNPILAGKFDATTPSGSVLPGAAASASSASSPGGNAAPVEGVARGQRMASMIGAVSSARQAKASLIQAENAVEQTDANVRKIAAEIEHLDKKNQLIQSQREQLAEIVLQIKEQVKLTMEQSKSASYDNVVKEQVTKFRKAYPDASVAKEMGMDQNLYKSLMQSMFQAGQWFK